MARTKKRVSMFEMIIVSVVLVGLIAFGAMTAYNFHMHNPPLVLDIGTNFQEISILCSSDGEDCYDFQYCPLNFDGDEYFEKTIDSTTGQFKVMGDLQKISQKEKVIDLSKYIQKTEGYGTGDNFTNAEGDINTNDMTVDKALKSSFCFKKNTRGHNLKQFKYSLCMTMTEGGNPDCDPKLYLINGIIYNQYMQPIKGAVDFESDTYITNGMIYFN